MDVTLIGRLAINLVVMARDLEEGKELVIHLENNNLSIRRRKKRK